MMSIQSYSGLKTVRHEFITRMAVNGQFYDPGAFIYRKQGRLGGSGNYFRFCFPREMRKTKFPARDI